MPLCYIFQPCRADETIIPKGKDAEKRNRKPDGGSKRENLQGGFNSRPVQSGETLKINIEREVEKVVEAETKTDFIGISSTITKKGRDGCIQVFTQVQGMPVTDKELAELRRLQEEAATKVDEMLKD